MLILIAEDEAEIARLIRLYLEKEGFTCEVCDDGETALRRHIGDTAGRFGTMRTLQRVRQRVNPVAKRELCDIVDLWTDLAMTLGEPELRRMDALARVQQKRRVAG